MKNTKKTKTLIIKSVTDNLLQVREFVSKFSVSCGFDAEEANKVILAVDEACTNIIKHAYKYAPKGEIKISAGFSNDKLEIILTDDGIVFDSGQIPDPDLSQYIKDKRIGGLGMFLMRKLMDEVIYERLDSGQNKVSLIKYLKK